MLRPLFTPTSARRAVTALRPAAERMCRLFREMERRCPPGVAPEQPVEPAYFALVWRLNAELARILRRGARVGDLRSGRLRFPAVRDGKRVWLCWKVGEPTKLRSPVMPTEQTPPGHWQVRVMLMSVNGVTMVQPVATSPSGSKWLREMMRSTSSTMSP